MKKRYQRKREYCYKHYFLHFPAGLNQQIDPHYKKDFEIDFTFGETPKHETVTITLTRDKPAEQTRNKK